MGMGTKSETRKSSHVAPLQILQIAVRKAILSYLSRNENDTKWTLLD